MATGDELDAKIAALKLIASRGLGIENAPGIGLTHDELGKPAQRMLEVAAGQDTHYSSKGGGGYKGVCGDGTDRTGGVDCSGLVSHGIEMPRAPAARHNDGPYWKGKWLETSNIYRDVTGPQERFELVQPDKIRPSDFPVYPDYRKDGHQHQGHVMAIVNPIPDIPDVVDSSETLNGAHLHPLAVDRIGPENMQKLVYARYKEPELANVKARAAHRLASK